MRLGFYGGTFDPPHVAHLAVARAAADRLHLDRVLIAPVGVQPLKRGTPATPYADRLAMVRLACAGDARLVPSEIDAARGDGRPNYTYDTLLRLRSEVQPRDKLFLLVGADAFRTLRQWYRAAELMGICCFAVAGRPGSPLERIDDFLPQGIGAEEECRTAELVEYGLHGAGAAGRKLYVFPDLSYAAAATSIRASLASDGEGSVAHVLDPQVAAYVRSKGLYRVQ
jgi:nicotinate-nucleotide adenylyltransferase